MRTLTASAGVSGILLLLVGQTGETGVPQPQDGLRVATLTTAGAPAHMNASTAAGSPVMAHTAVWDAPPAADASAETLTEVVQKYCVVCHNDRRMTGNLSLEEFAVESAPEMSDKAEKMIVKLRLGMMPPPGRRRPSADTLLALVETLERTIDDAFNARPAVATRLLLRMNRAEYERTIHALLGIEVDAEALLPGETISDGFDNIADVQIMYGTLLEGYMRAASHVSRLAVGEPGAVPRQASYPVSRLTSQWQRAEGAPYGTRGGTSVVHHFPADGQYVFRGSFVWDGGTQMFGRLARDQQLEISIDGERVALLDIDRWMRESDVDGVMVESDPIPVRAGPRRVSAAFLQTFEGPIEDVSAAIEQSLADTDIAGSSGVTVLPHLGELRIAGPYSVTGVSETPSRARIFTCRPTEPSEVRPCAEKIISRLGSQAYRRPLTDDDLQGLMSIYESAAGEGGFEAGIRITLQGILASPHFIFRWVKQPGEIHDGELYPISDMSLATRLGYFLWGTPPDDELVALAREGKLSDPEEAERQVWRMLKDPRSEALATRFAAQWLNLDGLNGLVPDLQKHPEWDDRLRDGLRRETELFFYSLVQEDRSVLDLFTADYTYLNERVARHYGISGVAGTDFRRVQLVDERRHGLLGKGAIHAITSFANRTSPVVRGLWVMRTILGLDPPPPPANVPPLDETAGVDEDLGRALTVRERMEKHRANPTCNACHQFMDPIGLALESWGTTGRWRVRDEGNPLDTRGKLWTGTEMTGSIELRDVLLDSFQEQILRNITENLMRYALGRRIQEFDKPAIRAIVKNAEPENYRMSSLILGVVKSNAFRMQRADVTASEEDQ